MTPDSQSSSTGAFKPVSVEWALQEFAHIQISAADRCGVTQGNVVAEEVLQSYERERNLVRAKFSALFPTGVIFPSQIEDAKNVVASTVLDIPEVPVQREYSALLRTAFQFVLDRAQAPDAPPESTREPRLTADQIFAFYNAEGASIGNAKRACRFIHRIRGKDSSGEVERRLAQGCSWVALRSAVEASLDEASSLDLVQRGEEFVIRTMQQDLARWNAQFPTLLPYIEAMFRHQFDATRLQVRRAFHPNEHLLDEPVQLYPVEVFSLHQDASFFEHPLRHPTYVADVELACKGNAAALATLCSADFGWYQFCLTQENIPLDQEQCEALLQKGEVVAHERVHKEFLPYNDACPDLIPRIDDGITAAFRITCELLHDHFHPKVPEAEKEKKVPREFFTGHQIVDLLVSVPKTPPRVISDPNKLAKCQYIAAAFKRLTDRCSRAQSPLRTFVGYLREMRLFSELQIRLFGAINDPEIELDELELLARHDENVRATILRECSHRDFVIDPTLAISPITFHAIRCSVARCMDCLNGLVTEFTQARVSLSATDRRQLQTAENAYLVALSVLSAPLTMVDALQALQTLEDLEYQIVAVIEKTHPHAHDHQRRRIAVAYQKIRLDLEDWFLARTHEQTRSKSMPKEVFIEMLDVFQNFFETTRGAACLSVYQKVIDEQVMPQCDALCIALPLVIDDACVIASYFDDITRISRNAWVDNAESAGDMDAVSAWRHGVEGLRQAFWTYALQRYDLQNMPASAVELPSEDEIPFTITKDWFLQEFRMHMGRLRAALPPGTMDFDLVTRSVEEECESIALEFPLQDHRVFSHFFSKILGNISVVHALLPQGRFPKHPEVSFLMKQEFYRLQCRIDHAIRLRNSIPLSPVQHSDTHLWWPIPSCELAVESSEFLSLINTAAAELPITLITRFSGSVHEASCDFYETLIGAATILLHALCDEMIPSPDVLRAIILSFITVKMGAARKDWAKRFAVKDDSPLMQSLFSRLENKLDGIGETLFLRFGPEVMKGLLEKELWYRIHAFRSACDAEGAVIPSGERRAHVTTALRTWVEAVDRSWNSAIGQLFLGKKDAVAMRKAIVDAVEAVPKPAAVPDDLWKIFDRHVRTFLLVRFSAKDGLLSTWRCSGRHSLDEILSPLNNAFLPPEGTASLEEGDVKKATLPIAHAMAASMLDAMVNAAGGVAVEARAVSEEIFSASWIDPLLDAAEAAVQEHCSTYGGTQTIKALLADHFTPARMQSCMGKCAIAVSKDKPPSMAQAMRKLAPIDVAKLPGDLSRDSIRAAVQNAVLGLRSEQLIHEEEEALLDVAFLVRGREPKREECDAIAVEWNKRFHAGFAIRTGEQIAHALKAFLKHEVPAAPSAIEEAAPESPELTELRRLVAENAAWIGGWGEAGDTLFGVPEMIVDWHEESRAHLVAINACGKPSLSLADALRFARVVADVRSRELLYTQETNGGSLKKRTLRVKRSKFNAFFRMLRRTHGIDVSCGHGGSEVLSNSSVQKVGRILRDLDTAMSGWQSTAESAPSTSMTEAELLRCTAQITAQQTKLGIVLQGLTSYEGWPLAGQKEMGERMHLLEGVIHDQERRLTVLRSDLQKNDAEREVIVAEMGRTRSGNGAMDDLAQRIVRNGQRGEELRVECTHLEGISAATHALQKRSKALVSHIEGLSVYVFTGSQLLADDQDAFLAEMGAFLDRAELYVCYREEERGMCERLTALRAEEERLKAALDGEQQENERRTAARENLQTAEAAMKSFIAAVGRLSNVKQS